MPKLSERCGGMIPCAKNFVNCVLGGVDEEGRETVGL